MSIRVITKEQFSDGTTIDGNRIEEAMQRLEEMVDNVPRGAIKTRFMQSQFVVGFAPDKDIKAPYNSAFPLLTSGNPMTGLTQNLERFKGAKFSDSDAFDIDTVLFFETSVQVDNPMIIHSLDCFMQQDMGVETPNFRLPGGSSSPYVPPTVLDVQLYILVDAPFIPEDRSQADTLIHKFDANMNGWLISPIAPSAAPDNDMLPAFPGGNVTGWALTLDNLNLPIPKAARVRFALGIPEYRAGSFGETLWGAFPWSTFSPSITMTILEPLTHV